MKKRTTEFTISIYGEGATEWHYFNQLKQNQAYRFNVDPELPISSRSAYKNRLLLIDKELKKNKEERANLIFLITDLDNIINSKSEHKKYLIEKEKYKKKGVIFIENNPCIEFWFLEHFHSSFSKKAHLLYEDVKPELIKFLPQYDKKKQYYISNRDFNQKIIGSYDLRRNAIKNGISGCSQDLVKDEHCNYSEMFKAIHYFRLLQKFFEIKEYITYTDGGRPNIEPILEDHKSMSIKLDTHTIALFKYERCKLNIIIDHQSFSINDELKLLHEDNKHICSLILQKYKDAL